MNRAFSWQQETGCLRARVKHEVASAIWWPSWFEDGRSRGGVDVINTPPTNGIRRDGDRAATARM
jgi:hypothetical protein